MKDYLKEYFFSTCKLHCILWSTCSIFWLCKFYFVLNCYILFQYCLMKDDSSAVSEGLSSTQAVVTWCGPWRESVQHPVKTQKERNGCDNTQILITFLIWESKYGLSFRGDIPQELSLIPGTASGRRSGAFWIFYSSRCVLHSLVMG